MLFHRVIVLRWTNGRRRVTVWALNLLFDRLFENGQQRVNQTILIK